MAIGYGRPPWIALILALSFGLYGLLKKKADVGPAESLTVETLVLLIPALAYLGYLEATGTATFGHTTPGHALLLAGAGVITAVPLLCFTASAIRVPLSTIGLLQYIAPVLQFLCGVLIAKETMPTDRWIGFAIVWAALAVFTYDSLRTAKHRNAVRRAAQAQPEPVSAETRQEPAETRRPPGEQEPAATPRPATRPDRLERPDRPRAQPERSTT